MYKPEQKQKKIGCDGYQNLLFFFYKMKTKKYQIVGTVQKIDRQFVETDATSTHISHLLMTTHITHLLMTTHITHFHE
jgi:hypothetical protein